MNIFQKIEELNLPKGAFVTVGGGLLVALDLIEWDEDVDICVTPEIFTELKSAGWRQEEWGDIPVLKHGIYDIGTRFGSWNVEHLLDDALTIQSVPFISPQKLLEWKRATGRPKDLEHIELIENYLRAHPIAVGDQE